MAEPKDKADNSKALSQLDRAIAEANIGKYEIFADFAEWAQSMNKL